MDLSSQNIALYWAVFGILLIIAEAFIPGLVSVFLGMAALVVALGIWVGVLEGAVTILTSWFVVSLILLVTIRNIFARWLPADTEVGEIDEDREALGKTVRVLKKITPDNSEGRIEYRGTSWLAKSRHKVFYPGQNVKLVAREGSVWIVDGLEN